MSLEEEIAMRLDWVRPIATAMRAVAIPEVVVQETMTYLLERMDAHVFERETGK